MGQHGVPAMGCVKCESIAHMSRFQTLYSYTQYYFIIYGSDLMQQLKVRTYIGGCVEKGKVKKLLNHNIKVLHLLSIIIGCGDAE